MVAKVFSILFSLFFVACAGGNETDEPIFPSNLSQSMMFVDPTSQSMQAYKEALSEGNSLEQEALKYIANQPSFIWLSSDWIPGPTGIKDRVSEYRTQSKGKILGFILYDVPGRDCGQYSSGGVKEINKYLSIVQQIIDGLEDSKAIIILEPDALGLSVKEGCELPLQTATQAISKAVSMLSESKNIKVYLDAGHGKWLTVEQIGPLLKVANIEKADGFVLNISNYVSTEVNHEYGVRIAKHFGNKKFLIDTSRNGRGQFNEDSEEPWCNPPGRALGQKPSFKSKLDGVEGFIWAKRPGESDGTCRKGAPAGVFMLERAVELYANAKKDGLI